MLTGWTIAEHSGWHAQASLCHDWVVATVAATDIQRFADFPDEDHCINSMYNYAHHESRDQSTAPAVSTQRASHAAAKSIYIKIPLPISTKPFVAAGLCPTMQCPSLQPNRTDRCRPQPLVWELDLTRSQCLHEPTSLTSESAFVSWPSLASDRADPTVASSAQQDTNASPDQGTPGRGFWLDGPFANRALFSTQCFLPSHLDGQAAGTRGGAEFQSTAHPALTRGRFHLILHGNQYPTRQSLSSLQGPRGEEHSFVHLKRIEQVHSSLGYYP